MKDQKGTEQQKSEIKNNRGGWLDRKRLALFVRTIRRSRGLTKAELAEKAGYESASMITAIESASRSPENEKFKDLANALDVSIEQLRGYGKIEISEKGWPKLSESEKIALYLVAPILKELNDEETRHLMDTGLLLCKAKGRTPAWRQTEYQAKKAERVAAEAMFRELYDEYMYREIGEREFAEKLGVDRETLRAAIAEFTAVRPKDKQE